jgi:TonB family protein
MKYLLVFWSAFLFSSIALVAQFYDFPPQCVGGPAEFKRVLKQELLYPPEDLVSNVGGKVTASFIIYSDGSIDSLRVIEGLSPEIDLEAKRLISLCQWLPPVLDGKKVSGFLVQKVIFKPSAYRKWAADRAYVPRNDPPGKIFPKENTNPPPQFFSGGSLVNFINRNLNYPEMAKSAGVEGLVEVRFIVEPSGRITSVGVHKGIGGGCDEEALRVIRKTNWKPGSLKGIQVRTQNYVPIQFKIDDIESSKSFFD